MPLHGPSSTRFRRAVALVAALAVTLLMLSGQVPTASAVPSLSATSTTTTSVPPNATTPLAGVGVTGLGADSDIQVTISTDRGTLTVVNTSGLTLAFGNSWSGDSSITFTGTRDDLNAGLATLLISTGNDTGSTAAVSISALESAPGYIYAPSNQHFYTYVLAPAITWDAARTAAAERTFLGQSGYLATIPNAEVNSLISSRIEGASNVWFGTESADTFTQTPARTWSWVDGPLAGDPVSYCANTYQACDFINDEGLYHSWGPGEPNNSGLDYDEELLPIPHSGEWVAVTNWGGSFGLWNDVPADVGEVADGYLVEFGDQPIGASSFPGVVKATSNVSIVTVPDAPTDVSAVRGNTTATVSFTPPADDGGSPITGYEVTLLPGGDVVPCSTSPCEITGLTNGDEYSFTVHAVNANGNSVESDPSNPVVPATVPSRPGNVAVSTGDRSATVTFDVPDDDGGSAIISYTVTGSPGNHVVTCPGSPCVVTGLTNGTGYSFTMVATNGVGDSDPTDPYYGTPIAAPDAPTDVVATRGNGSATATFNAPADDGGNPIYRYRVTAAPGGATQRCSDSPCVIGGLTNGTEYELTVVAINEIGVSVPSDPSNPVTPATVPDAPVSFQVERGDGSADLTFLAPNSDGGAAISRYEVSRDGGETWATISTSGSAPISATLTGLTNGTPYQFEVRAVNDVGHGPASEPQGVTPARAPGAPSGVTATRGDARATVAFTPPADNGSPITGYTVTSAPGGHVVTCPGSPCVVTGLDNGTEYTFTVVATNDVGSSTDSDPSNAVTPVTTPDAPVLESVLSTAGALVLSFTVPGDDGGAAIAGYEASTDGGESWVPLTVSGTGPLTATLTALTNGSSYPVAVRAVNAVGGGTPSNTVNGKPATVPAEPRSVAAAVHGPAATVSWTAPSDDGGSPVTHYVVTAAPGGQTCTSVTTSCTFPSLVAGQTYTFSVVAVNLADGLTGTGTGSPGVSAPVRVTTVPGAPSALAVTPGDRQLTLTFDPPVDDGGKPVSSYQVSLDAGATWATVRTTGTAHRVATVAPVLNGETYAVRVRAVNTNGAGPGTAPVSVATVQWFADPVSPAEHRAEIPVPAKPTAYRGPLRHTTASYRSAAGLVAFPGSQLKGRQLQAGQAVNLANLFRFDSSTLSSKGRKQVKSAAVSMRYVHKVTCEGYADYGGKAAHEKKLAKQRAAKVCSTLKSYAKQLTSRTVQNYGSGRPVVVGGSPSDRGANRRVVVVIRG